MRKVRPIARFKKITSSFIMHIIFRSGHTRNVIERATHQCVYNCAVFLSTELGRRLLCHRFDPKVIYCIHKIVVSHYFMTAPTACQQPCPSCPILLTPSIWSIRCGSHM